MAKFDRQLSASVVTRKTSETETEVVGKVIWGLYQEE